MIVLQTILSPPLQEADPLSVFPMELQAIQKSGTSILEAGRPVRQDLIRINEAIQNHTIKDLPEMQTLISKAKKKIIASI